MTDAPAEAVFCLDTSALVKRYVVERGSSWLAQLCGPGSEKTIATALITQSVGSTLQAVVANITAAGTAPAGLSGIS